MSPEPFIPRDQLLCNNTLETMLPGGSLDMSVEHPVSPDHLFCHNASEKLLPEYPGLEGQCPAGTAESKPTWWRQIWGSILSLIFKTKASAALSRADRKLSSTPNRRAHSGWPTLETVRETSLVDPVAIYTSGVTRAKPDSQSIPTFEKTIRVRSTPPPPTPDTLDPCQDSLLSDRELDALYSFFENASYISPPMSFPDRSTARERRQRDSTAIPIVVSPAPCL